ncbi:CU044_5270 family protein [Bailinhaonella thermotolerans]|uniref:CU044_5270 family protein n=1 Tax=Bailinhaonella thermotolerans TaxID=1070861 RepID=UPI001A8CCD2F|nr:CU044_5270 family protein [Bailinhaonella thermotolerans]
MDEMNELNRLRAEVPEPGPAGLRNEEARLMAAIAAESAQPAAAANSAGSGEPTESGPDAARPAGPGGRRPWWPRLGLRVAAAAGLAAALTVAVAVYGGDDTTEPNSPTPRDSGELANAVPVSAREVLDRAAAAAARDELRPRPGQFLYYESRTMYPVYAPPSTNAETGEKTAEYRYLYRTNRRMWTSVDGSRDGLLAIENLEPRPMPGWPMPPQAAQERRGAQWMRLASCPERLAPEYRRDFASLARLPKTPEGMRAHLYRGAADTSPSPGQDKEELTDARAWTAVGDLIRESYMPAAQRAALFRAAATIPGVTLVKDAEDAAGRKGVAVARVDRGERAEIIFDPKTYRYLGERSIVVDEGKARSPVGSLLASTAELKVSVVDAPPEPGGAVAGDASCDGGGAPSAGEVAPPPRKPSPAPSREPGPGDVPPPPPPASPGS